MSATNIVWHSHEVTKETRSALNHQKPCILWFTGFSGSGKSTVANAVERRLAELAQHTYLLDGDNVRARLNIRDFMDTMRASGVQGGGPPPLNQADRQAFANVLDRYLAGSLKAGQK